MYSCDIMKETLNYVGHHSGKKCLLWKLAKYCNKIPSKQFVAVLLQQNPFTIYLLFLRAHASTTTFCAMSFSGVRSMLNFDLKRFEKLHY